MTMKALIITESYLPKLGGVEKHIAGIKPYLEQAGFELKIFDKSAVFQNRSLKKFFGLLQIWWALFKKVEWIKEAEVIFIHDVFIYYLPFKFLFPKKKIITTFHGWEKIYPIPWKNILYKQIAQKLSHQTISIGNYINQYYRLKSQNNYISYGAVALPTTPITLNNKIKNSFLFVGRLEKDTGLAIFLDFLDILSKKKIIFSAKFCGDGPMKKNCLPYGEVLGFVDVRKFLATSEFCFAGGYLSILEAMAYQNIVFSGFSHQLKKDYLLSSPFASKIICTDQAQALFEQYQNLSNQDQIIETNYKFAKKFSFAKLANLYIKLTKEK